MKRFISLSCAALILSANAAQACAVNFRFDESKSKDLITNSGAFFSNAPKQMIKNELEQAKKEVVKMTIFENADLAVVAYDELLKEKGASIDTLDKYTYAPGDAGVFLPMAAQRIASSAKRYAEENLSPADKEALSKLEKWDKIRAGEDLAKKQLYNPQAIKAGLVEYASTYGCSSNPSAYAERVIHRISQ